MALWARSARIFSTDWFGLHTSPPLPLLLSLRPPPLWCKDCTRNVVPQDFQDQTLSRQEAEAEQANSTVDQNEDWQQDQVQLQEETLEEDQVGLVNAQVFRSPASSTCWAQIWRGSHTIWNSGLFVQILWLCLCLTIKDL